MTGRGAGFCGGATEEDFVKAAGRRVVGRAGGGGRGGGRSFGFGRGWAGGEYRRAVDLDDSSAKTESLLDRIMGRLEAIEEQLAGRQPKD